MGFEHELVEKSATVVNEATPGIQGYGESMEDLGVSISNTFVGTVALQRSLDGDTEANYIDLETYTAPAEINVIPNYAAWYRLKLTAYTSGQADLAIKS